MFLTNWFRRTRVKKQKKQKLRPKTRKRGG